MRSNGVVHVYTYYNTIKDKFRQENCLQLTQKRNQGGAEDLAKHRLSEHKLNIEVWRYQKKAEREDESKKELYDDSSNEAID